MWQLFTGLHVLIHFVVHAALQFGALSCKFLRIERQVLETCSRSAHAGKTLNPCGAAQLSAARTETTNTSGLLAGAYLLHLYSHVEYICQYLDELAEVHTSVGYVVEDGLVAVALILHVTDFHLQPQILGNLSGFYHGLVLACFGLLVFFHIALLGQTIHALYLLFAFQVGLLYLQGSQSAS